MTVKKKTKNRGSWILLSIVGLFYLLTFLMNAEAGKEALFACWNIVKMIAPILLVVFFLMALLNTFIDSKNIAKHLGEESGVRGWIIALVGGVLSHGPAYIWYPLLADLRKNGARDGLVVAFFYTRSIKLPWLPLMISYFGLAFTVVLTLLVILSAWVQGMIADKIVVLLED
jgi:uncharacterized membrane protein YraQ (UPF0718 family)